jgi:polysaccharide biosynthesis PFTS motif protein
MFWYSENSHPKIFNTGNTSFDYNNFRDIAVKEHLVWTEEFARFLIGVSEQKVTPIGSILFYNYEINGELPKDYDCLIFDVTPFKDSDEGDFYSTSNCKLFIDSLTDIEKTLIPNKVNFVIKQKRELSNRHDEQYIRNLRQTGWKVLPVESNLYNIISRSKCVIGIPFTSAVLIAAELKIPCFYFHPMAEIKLNDIFNGIRVIKSKDTLRHEILNVIEKIGI